MNSYKLVPFKGKTSLIDTDRKKCIYNWISRSTKEHLLPAGGLPHRQQHQHHHRDRRQRRISCCNINNHNFFGNSWLLNSRSRQPKTTSKPGSTGQSWRLFQHRRLHLPDHPSPAEVPAGLGALRRREQPPDGQPELADQGPERRVADQPLLTEQVQAQQLQHRHIKVIILLYNFFLIIPKQCSYFCNRSDGAARIFPTSLYVGPLAAR